MSHGGKIWIESNRGKGSTFKFVLPIEPVKDLEGRFKKIEMFDIEKNNKESIGQ